MTSLTDRVDALFAQWDKNDSPGCVLAVIKNGEFVYQRGYGMADLERGIRISPDSKFDIGSTGKQFTATVIAILANQGYLSLDNPIRRFFPEMPAYADQITIRHLIHHTSGLRDYLSLMDICGMDDVNFYPEELLFDLIIRQKRLNFKPGKEFLYSNTGYFLLGRIAERVTGKHVTELIKELILDPIGMKQTTFNKDYHPLVKDRALSYDKDESGSFVNALALCGGYGDGAIITNVQDLLLWDHNFYNNKLNNAQPDLMEQLHQTGKLNNGKSLKYAFGLMIDSYKEQKIVMHGGSWAGYRTEMMRFPHQNFTVICISNLGSVDPTMLSQQVADIFLGSQPNSRHVKKIYPKAIELEHLVGIYQGKYLTVEIYIKNNTFYFSNGNRQYRTIPLGKKKLQLDGTLDTLSFSGAHNEQLSYNEYGAQAAKFKRLQYKRSHPPSLSVLEGEYYNAELDVHHILAISGNALQLQRTTYDKPNTIRYLTEDTLQCDLGEMRFTIKNGTAKGFTLNTDRAVNLKFRKIKKDKTIRRKT